MQWMCPCLGGVMASLCCGQAGSGTVFCLRSKTIVFRQDSHNLWTANNGSVSGAVLTRCRLLVWMSGACKKVQFNSCMCYRSGCSLHLCLVPVPLSCRHRLQHPLRHNQPGGASGYENDMT